MTSLPTPQPAAKTAAHANNATFPLASPAVRTSSSRTTPRYRLLEDSRANPLPDGLLDGRGEVPGQRRELRAPGTPVVLAARREVEVTVVTAH